MPTVDELFSIERVWYEFEVEEIQDLEYAENFDIALISNLQRLI